MKLTAFLVISPGTCRADAAYCSEPLSFWGGVDVKTGRIIDVHHSSCGMDLEGRVLCIPQDRGSCSGSGVMLEMIRLGTAPAGILCIEAEPVLALAPMIGERLYGWKLPIRTVSEEDYKKISSACWITFAEDAILIDEN